MGLNRDIKDKLSGFVQLEAMLLAVGLNRDTKDRLSLVVQLVVIDHSGMKGARHELALDKM